MKMRLNLGMKMKHNTPTDRKHVCMTCGCRMKNRCSKYGLEGFCSEECKRESIMVNIEKDEEED